MRGHSLRVFTDFMEKYDPGLKEGKSGHFAGLQRIGDPNDGTALWTTLTDPQEIKSALEARTREREAEAHDGNKYFQRAVESLARQTAGEVEAVGLRAKAEAEAEAKAEVCAAIALKPNRFTPHLSLSITHTGRAKGGGAERPARADYEPAAQDSGRSEPVEPAEPAEPAEQDSGGPDAAETRGHKRVHLHHRLMAR